MRSTLPGKMFAIATRVAGAATLVVVCAFGQSASAQNEAPFTIRQPQDGSTVREKVAVKVPLASIPEGAYVAYYIDGAFQVALSPTAEQREKMKAGDLFVFVWDTKLPYKQKGVVKETPAAEGEHSVSARLYTPVEKQGSSILKETSSVKVVVQNKYPAPPAEAIKLKYQYRDGDSKTYTRSGSTSIVAGLTQGAGGTEDQEMVAQNSELLVAVEDKYKDGDAIVRNLLKKLSVRQGGQETSYPPDSLPKALYQELDPWGNVKYQNNSVSFDQFAELGIPVSATLELPILPQNPMSVGASWESRDVSLDLPGTAPDKQPRVTVKSTLEGVEWQGGYPTAKIHQHYDGSQGLKLKTITVGTIEIMNPQIVFDQDVYLAFRSGTLVKVVRKLDITGKTLQSVGTAGPGGMGAGGGIGGAGMAGGEGMAAGGPMSGRGGMGAMSSMASMPGMGGRGKMGSMGEGGMGVAGRGARGSSAGMSMMAGRGARPGSGGYTGGPGSSSYPGSRPGMTGGAGGYTGGPGSFVGGMGGATGQQPTQITLKSVTTTELQQTTVASAGSKSSNR